MEERRRQEVDLVTNVQGAEGPVAVDANNKHATRLENNPSVNAMSLLGGSASTPSLPRFRLVFLDAPSQLFQNYLLDLKRFPLPSQWIIGT